MENFPKTSTGSIGERVREVLGRATARMRHDALYADSKGYESVEELADSTLQNWDYDTLTYNGEPSRWYTGDKKQAPDEVINTRELLSLPDETLEKLGPKADMLRGYLARYEGDNNEAIQYFELAQSGFINEGNMDTFAKASSKLARAARDAALPDAAEAAHRNAIHGYMLSQQERNDKLIEKGTMDPVDATSFNLSVFYEYRHLARTLGTPAAVEAHHTDKLEALLHEVLQLGPVAQSEAVQGVLVLMQIENELACWSRFGGHHQNKARHYGFICSAADMGGGAGLMVALGVLKNGKVPHMQKDTVAGWANTLSRNAPDALIGGSDFYAERNSIYW